MSAVISSPDQAIRILRLPQVCSVTGLGRSMIYQMEADLRFPEACENRHARGGLA